MIIIIIIIIITIIIIIIIIIIIMIIARVFAKAGFPWGLTSFYYFWTRILQSDIFRGQIRAINF